MKGSHAPVGAIAAVDQIRAKVDTALDTVIAEFERHAGTHDGDLTCPFARLSLQAERYNPHDLAALLAAAVARIAQLKTGEPQ